MKPLFAAQLDVASSALLSSKTQLARRSWFFMDEVYTLGFIDSMESLVSLGRKKGGCPVLGIQSLSQVREAYGPEKAQTILSCLGTWLILCQQDDENEKYMIGYLGEQEILKQTFNQNKAEGGKSEGRSEQKQVQNAILRGELKKLPKRKGILNIYGAMPPAWVQIPITELQPVAETFVDVKHPGAMRIVRPAAPSNGAHLASPDEGASVPPNRFDV